MRGRAHVWLNAWLSLIIFSLKMIHREEKLSTNLSRSMSKKERTLIGSMKR